MERRSHGYDGIPYLYKNYRTSLNDYWFHYHFVNNYYPFLRSEFKKKNTPSFKYPEITGEHILDRTESLRVHGIIDSELASGNPKKTLLSVIMETEHFLQEISLIVYKKFPNRIEGDEYESKDRSTKLIKIILDSNDKDEMLLRITEEKIRQIFYGNPVDFFKNDKAKLGLKQFFSNNHSNTLKDFAEIIARRNIYVHNNGKVDRKYLREADTSLFSLGQKAIIDEPYLSKTFRILRGLCAATTFEVLKNNYGLTPSFGKLKSDVKKFNREFNV